MHMHCGVSTLVVNDASGRKERRLVSGCVDTRRYANLLSINLPFKSKQNNLLGR